MICYVCWVSYSSDYTSVYTNKILYSLPLLERWQHIHVNAYVGMWRSYTRINGKIVYCSFAFWRTVDQWNRTFFSICFRMLNHRCKIRSNRIIIYRVSNVWIKDYFLTRILIYIYVFIEVRLQHFSAIWSNFKIIYIYQPPSSSYAPCFVIN